VLSPTSLQQPPVQHFVLQQWLAGNLVGYALN
jgi:hypothetical protein